MRCVVVTDFNLWYFDKVADARKFYDRVVRYAKKYQNKGIGPEGEPADFVELWRYTDWKDPYGDTWPMKCIYFK